MPVALRLLVKLLPKSRVRFCPSPKGRVWLSFEPEMNRFVYFLLISFPVLVACNQQGKKPPLNDQQPEAAEQKPVLFDGKSLAGWEACNYVAAGEVSVDGKTGVLRINRGEILSGVRRPGYDKEKLPKLNYEVTMEARRVEGDDFFYCLTFPYRDTHATFVLGGWGGAVCGISSIDYMDAMDNSTMTAREFVEGTWYKIRLVVSDHRFQGFVDGDRIVNIGIKGRKIGMRFGEIEESVPFAISTFRTTGEYRNIEIRKLNESEIAAARKLDEEDEF